MKRIYAAIAAGGDAASVGSGPSAHFCDNHSNHGNRHDNHSLGKDDASIGSIRSDHRVRLEFVKDKDREHAEYYAAYQDDHMDINMDLRGGSAPHSRGGSTGTAPSATASQRHAHALITPMKSSRGDGGGVGSVEGHSTISLSQKRNSLQSKASTKSTKSRAKTPQDLSSGPVKPTPTNFASSEDFFDPEGEIHRDGADGHSLIDNQTHSSATTNTLVRDDQNGRFKSHRHQRKKKPVKNCGRIQFENFNVKVEEEAPPTLTCEECEKSIAISYCRECQEVFCESCCTLCHMREGLGAILHPHERDGHIRPIRVGDTSRVQKYEPYYMPNEEVFEDDMLVVRDLSMAHSLASDTQSGLFEPPSDEALEAAVHTHMPKYKVKDIVLFIDPVDGMEAYGRVISEWVSICGILLLCQSHMYHQCLLC
jgi:hypothetical protein